MATNSESDCVGPEIPEFLRQQSEDEQGTETISTEVAGEETKDDEPPNKRRRQDEDEELKNSFIEEVKNQGNAEFKVPKLPKKVLKFEETYLRSIPRATQYEKSFMHRDIVMHVFATQ